MINVLKSISSAYCVIIFGGSFDPVHNGHVAIGEYFASLLQPNELRIIPAGISWKKNNLHASAIDRVEMLKRAFDNPMSLIVIDEQEIQRSIVTYTIDTLKSLRKELGQMVSIIFLMGADQLQYLSTWQDWKELFNYAHLCVVTRPGFSIDFKKLPIIVSQEFFCRIDNIHILRHIPHGKTCLISSLNINISSTLVRNLLQRNQRPISLIPIKVLNYIEQYHLYIQ